MKIIKKCKICGSTNFKFLFKGSDRLIGVPGEFDLVRCRRCGVEFINPQPSYKEQEKYYSPDKYYSLKSIDKDSFKLRLKLFLYKLYFTKNKNYLYRILFSPIKFMLRSTIIKENSRVLDVGCGSGQFLFEMKQLGLKTSGVEVGDFDEYEDLNIKKTNLLDAKYPNDYFDLITLNHVMEHIDNPLMTLKEIHRILNTNGKFIIGVPNINSLANKLFKHNWLSYDIPRHLFDYSDELIINILRKHKFKIVNIRYNSCPTQFVMSIYYLFGIRKRTGIINKLLELLFIPLTLLVNFLKLGDQIEIVCEKS